MSSPSPTPAASAFWSEFALQSEVLADQFHAGQSRAVFDVVDAMLARHGAAFCFDVTADDAACHLIFSPEGDAAAARSIDAWVAAAPAVPGWVVHARRPRRHPRDVRAIVRHLYHVDLDACRFRPDPRDAGRTVRVFLPAASDLTPAERSGLADTLVWHALGERFAAERGVRAEVSAGGVPPDASGLVSLEEWVRQAGTA